MSKTLPVPPENRSDKGPGGDPREAAADASGRPPVPENLEEQGRHGNIHQNTHHQGYQQAR